MSRRYGGIHFESGDLQARALGGWSARSSGRRQARTSTAPPCPETVLAFRASADRIAARRARDGARAHALLAAALAAASWAGADDNAVTVIRAGTLIDGRSDTPPPRPGHRGAAAAASRACGAAAAVPGARRAPRTIDLRRPPSCPGLIDAHTHLFLQGQEAERGRLRRPAPEARHRLPRGAGHGGGAARAGAGLHHPARRGDRGRGLRRRRHQAGDRRRATSRGRGSSPPRAGSRPPAATRSRATRPRSMVPKGVQIVDGPVEARKAARRAARERRGLDQGLHDAPLVGGRRRARSSRSRPSPSRS